MKIEVNELVAQRYEATMCARFHRRIIFLYFMKDDQRLNYCFSQRRCKTEEVWVTPTGLVRFRVYAHCMPKP